MEELNKLIKEASNEFECHNFQTSLALYLRCIRQCERQGFPTYILHNLKSSQAALRAITGDKETALSVLNEVLSIDKQHWPSLLRRSQIYKKQSNYKKALKDVEILWMYAPDNMQIAAFKQQLKNLMIKHQNNSCSNQSENQEEILDKEPEQEEKKTALFSKLKKIDRCSVSIILAKGRKSRKSRVTITGEQQFCYESDKYERKYKQQDNLIPQLIRQKFIQIQEQLTQDKNIQEKQSVLPSIVVKSTPMRTKSILKNRNSILYVEQNKNVNDLISTTEGKKLIEKLQNIQGHIIGSEKDSSHNSNEKLAQGPQNTDENKQPKMLSEKKQNKTSKSRKSCIKRSSFALVAQQNHKKDKKKKNPSIFGNLIQSPIDGKIIKSDKKFYDVIEEKQKQNVFLKNQKSIDNQSDVGSHFNIFGSGNVVINDELKENLGFCSDDILQLETSDKKSKSKKLSNLKTNSTTAIKESNEIKYSNDNQLLKQTNQNKVSVEKRAKKSVMFRNCQ